MSLYFSILVIVFGLVIGSFLNFLIWRWYKEESLGGRSHCPNCHHMIAWYDNIPIVSFFILGRRCRHCREKISWQYPLVEFFTALLFFVIFQIDKTNPDFTWLLLRDGLLVVTLVIVFVYDLRWQLLPMMPIWSMSIVVFILNLVLGFSFSTILASSLLATSFFLFQYILTKKRGLGEGDIWLGAFLGIAFPSFSQLFLIMLVSYTVGALTSFILLIFHKKKLQSRIALGPFLVIGALVTLIWGERIISWYYHLL